MKNLNNKSFASLKKILKKIMPFISLVFIVLVRLLVAFALYVLFIPKFMLGNLFFGSVPILYNVKLASFFYQQSIHYDQERGLPVPFVHHQLSRTYFIQGELEKSLDEIAVELAYYPLHYHSYYIRGLTLGYMERYEEAISAFSSYIQGNPRTWAARNDKAWLQFRIGDMEGALSTIEPAYKSDPNNAWVLNTYGTILLNLEKYKEAVVVLTHAKEMVSSLSESDWGRAYPGNDPRIYSLGLSSMKKSITENLYLAKQKSFTVDKK